MVKGDFPIRIGHLLSRESRLLPAPLTALHRQDVVTTGTPIRTVWRRWLVYLLPWTVVMLLAGGLIYRARVDADLASLANDQKATVTTASRELARVVQRIMLDAQVLASTGNFEAFATDPGSLNPNGQALAAEWQRFLSIKRTYDGIRYLDEHGQELVRADYHNGLPETVSGVALRNQSRHSSFRQAMALEKGELYVSPIELNTINDAIESPHKPTIRVAMPVFDSQGRRRGAFVLNYLAAELLARLESVSAPGGIRLMMLNGAGQWVLGAARGEEWAFMFGRSITLEMRYPAAWQAMQEAPLGQRQDSQGFWTWETVRPTLMRGGQNVSIAIGETWRIVAYTTADELTRQARERASHFALGIAFGLFVLVLAGWRLALAGQRQERAERDLRTLNETLEQQVLDRTKRLQNEMFDRQTAERRYRESSDQYQRMIATTVDGYWLLDDHGGFLDVNPAACDIFGATREVMLSMTMADLDADRASGGLERRFAELMVSASARFEARLRRVDGQVIDVEISAAYLADYLRFVAFVRDISERKRADHDRRLAAMVMSNTDEAIFVVSPQGMVMTANPALSKITGMAPEEIVGAPVDALGLSIADSRQALGQMLPRQPSWRGEVRGRRRSGEVFSVWLSATTVRDEGGAIGSYVCVFSDITEIKESQARLDFLAHHDALTGLANRLLFHARLEHAIERAERAQGRIAVMFIDLDRFKEVNDSFGHAMGDQLLIDLSGAFAKCLRAEDTLARLGGDEFVILLEQLADAEAIEPVLAKVMAVFPRSVGDAEHNIAVTASIGIAVYPDHAKDSEALVKTADVAMYRAKEGGRNRAVFAGSASDDA